FVWKKMRGDFILQTRVELVGPGAQAHRKLGLIVRKTLDADSPYADVAVHGEGLTSLQYRRTAAGATEEIQSPLRGPDVVQLEPQGRAFTMSVARFGDPFVTNVLSGLDLGDEVYVGLFLCSHDADTVEKGIFRDVRIVRPARDGFVPYRDYIGSVLEVLDVTTGRRQAIYRSAQPFEAPNWTRDGAALIYNGSGRGVARGRLFRFDLTSRQPASLVTVSAAHKKHDHVLSCDGAMPAISDQSAPDGKSRVYTLPATGGTPRRITEAGPSYLHGWSPDGKDLVFTGGRNDEFDVYKVAADGSGPETKLPGYKGRDDGPEDSRACRLLDLHSVRG